MLKSYKQHANRASMLKAGWAFPDPPEFGECRTCGQPVEWVRSPKGKNIPLDRGTCHVHFESCGKPSTTPSPAGPPAGPPAAPAAQQLAAALTENTAAVKALTDLLQRRAATSR